jgi:hypothetical protein
MIGSIAALLLLTQGQIIVPIDHPGAVPDLAARVEVACPMRGATDLDSHLVASTDYLVPLSIVLRLEGSPARHRLLFRRGQRFTR